MVKSVTARHRFIIHLIKYHWDYIKFGNHDFWETERQVRVIEFLLKKIPDHVKAAPFRHLFQVPSPKVEPLEALHLEMHWPE